MRAQQSRGQPTSSAQVEAIVTSTLSAVHSKAVPFGVMQVHGGDHERMVLDEFQISEMDARCI